MSDLPGSYQPSDQTGSPAFRLHDGPPPPPFGPPPKTRKLWPWLAGGAALAVMLVGAVAVAALVGDEPSKPLSSGNGPAATPAAPEEIRVNDGCNEPGREATSLSGRRVRCDGSTWQPIVETEPPAPPPPADDLTKPVGATFTLTSDDGLEAEYTLTKTTTKTRASWDTRPKRGVYLLAHVKVVVKSGSEYVCSCSFSFVTTSGRAYPSGEPTYPQFSGFEELAAADVAGGQNVDGWVAFDVPKSALKGGRIAFKPNSFEGDVAYWTL